MLCPVCQHDNPEEQRYCGECGHALAARAAAVPRYRDLGVQRRREIAIVVGGVVLLLAAAFGLSYWISYVRSPEAVVRRFIDADRAGNVAEQDLLVTDSGSSRFILHLLQGLRQRAGVSLFDRARVTHSALNGDAASVDVQVYLPTTALPPAAGTTTTVSTAPVGVTFFLVRRNGEWKIDPAQTAGALAGALAAGGLQAVLSGLFPLGLPAGVPPIAGIPVGPQPPPGTAPPAVPGAVR